MSSEATNSSGSDYAIEVDGLGKCYQIYDKPSDRLKQMMMRGRKQYYKEFWALKDVSFKIKRGETVGIIGRNGSGKSTLLQMICGTLNPSNGNIKTCGRVAALLELGSGFNPEFTGHENIYMNASILGLMKNEIDERYEKIVEFADVGDFINRPVKTYSSGMYVRLAFAIAINVDPDILIVDEALSVGDAYFQAKCARIIRSIIDNGATVLFVSHDTATIKSLCNRAILLESGRGIFFGDVNTAVEKYYAALVEGQSPDTQVSKSKNVALSLPSQLTEKSELFEKFAAFQRIKNGSAEFCNVVLMNAEGKPVDTVLFGEQVTLRQIINVNSRLPQLGVAYHIRDKNGLDIIYSDTDIENKHINLPEAGDAYVIEWTFTAYLREGSYVVASMLSVPVDMSIGSVEVVDFVPISTKFTVSRGRGKTIYASVYWKNTLQIQRVKNGST